MGQYRNSSISLGLPSKNAKQNAPMLKFNPNEQSSGQLQLLRSSLQLTKYFFVALVSLQGSFCLSWSIRGVPIIPAQCHLGQSFLEFSDRKHPASSPWTSPIPYCSPFPHSLLNTPGDKKCTGPSGGVSESRWRRGGGPTETPEARTLLLLVAD